MRALVPLAAVVLLVGLAPPAQSLPEGVLCREPQAGYCVDATLSDASLSCERDGLVYTCTESVVARVEIRSLLPGRADLRFTLERITCDEPGPCDMTWDDQDLRCAWDQQGGCVMEHTHKRTFTYAPSDGCLYHGVTFGVRGGAGPGPHLASDGAGEWLEIYSGCG